jgi:ATP-dependent Clp protease ATP-binding subunit ClpA
VELSAKYIGDRKLPDKAIDVIDEVGASQHLLPESKRKKIITRQGHRSRRGHHGPHSGQDCQLG